MPRLAPRLLQHARRLDRRLPYLLMATRDLESAQSELRWLREKFGEDQTQLWRACVRRSRQYPLQYILGSQPFERLDVLCKPGVLIPRWETEEWATKLAGLIRGREGVKIVDLCTGTGCIPLLLATAVRDSQIWGLDISDKALDLFEHNIEHNRDHTKSNTLTAVKGNALSDDLPLPSIDLVTTNPPYIPSLYDPSSMVARSVRLFEPKLALLGDKEFYTASFKHTTNLNAQALVCEVGEQDQIDHVIDLAKNANLSLPSSDQWASGQMNDASNIPRVAILWKPSWAELSSLCTKLH